LQCLALDLGTDEVFRQKPQELKDRHFRRSFVRLYFEAAFIAAPALGHLVASRALKNDLRADPYPNEKHQHGYDN